MSDPRPARTRLRHVLLGALLIVVGAATPRALAAEDEKPDPMEFMKQVDQRHRISRVTKQKMILQTKGGSKRIRTAKFTWYQPDGEQGDKTHIEFTAPAEIDGIETLSIEQKSGGDTVQWLYLPAFEKTRRIGIASLGDRFAETDLWFADIVRRYPREYEYEILGSDEIGGHECWVLKRTPSDEELKKETPYGKARLWVRKDIQFRVKAQYYDKKGEPIKEARWMDLVNVRGKTWRQNKLVVTDVQRGHRTTMVVKERNLREKFPDGRFSPRNLGN